MNTNEVFGSYHPVINFAFFILAISFGMLIYHPAYLIVSLFLSCTFYLTIKKDGWKFILGMVPLALGVSFLNPVFNNRGETVLFTYLNGREYTLEDLYYGVVLGIIFVNVIIWFASYQEIMTSDKFLYIFGKITPSVSLILTMVLRLIPEYRKKVKQISGARKCIGKSVSEGNYMQKAEHGMTIVSVLTTWALEGGVMMADSMQSRGYGCGKRTTFSIYKWRKKESIMLAGMMSLALIIIYCMIHSGTQTVFLPKIVIADNSYMWVGLISYGVLLSIPTILNITEKITWNILKSRI